mmetsp:Transcript_30555/g.93494  ORF Transcript_30555/g.93494 Transcript_30555/m.93494 type:complete len:111 (-) Transcript_30555:187-519(-)
MLLAGPAVRSAIACALCALALSSSPQLAISAEATPDARAALPYVSDTKVSIQPAAHPSRTGPFYQASVKEEAELREAAKQIELPVAPPGSDLDWMLSQAGSSTDPRAHGR